MNYFRIHTISSPTGRKIYRYICKFVREKDPTSLIPLQTALDLFLDQYDARIIYDSTWGSVELICFRSESGYTAYQLAHGSIE